MGVYPYLQCVTLQVVTGRPQDPIIVVVVVDVVVITDRNETVATSMRCIA